MEHSLHTGTAKLTLVNNSSPLIISSRSEKAESADLIAARLPGVLQTTLELEEVVLLFEQQLQKVLAFDSFHYQHEPIHCRIDTASQHHHRCHYKLEMNSVFLGDLTLSRRKKFSTAELKLLEDFLCLLVYPLRNCLLYRQALASALRDELTGLGNRAAFDTSLDREIDLAQRHHTPLSLVVLDIDNFKTINDSYGHISGDHALKTLADTLTKTLRRSDIAYRFGGEEFTLILSNTDLDAAELVAERVRKTVAQMSCDDGKQTFGFSISLGIAQLSANEDSYKLFDRADHALYRAKRAGKNVTICAPANKLAD